MAEVIETQVPISPWIYQRTSSYEKTIMVQRGVGSIAELMEMVNNVYRDEPMQDTLAQITSDIISVRDNINELVVNGGAISSTGMALYLTDFHRQKEEYFQHIDDTPNAGQLRFHFYRGLMLVPAKTVAKINLTPKGGFSNIEIPGGEYWDGNSAKQLKDRGQTNSIFANELLIDRFGQIQFVDDIRALHDPMIDGLYQDTRQRVSWKSVIKAVFADLARG